MNGKLCLNQRGILCNLKHEKTEFILVSNVTYMENENGKDQIKFYCSFNCSENIYKDYENGNDMSLGILSQSIMLNGDNSYTKKNVGCC